MRNITRTLFYGLLALALISNINCQRTSDQQNQIPAPVDPLTEKIIASIKGLVLDENKQPVSNALIKAGSYITTTDNEGIFYFNNIQLPKNAGFVLVEKDGYLKGSRTIFANAGVANYVEIQLIPKVTKGNFVASAGGTVIIGNGSSVSFPAGAIINPSTNSSYQNTVNVIGSYLDPTDPILSAIMPGNLTGLNTNNEQRILQTFGMIAVELEGSNGQKLNIAGGKSATLTVPIPASLQNSAPSTIPMWFFDESKGLWKEEGIASKQGSNYVGMVSHFTFWNYDVPFEMINLKMALKDQTGNALVGFKVQLSSVDKGTVYGFTDATGTANGAVPIGTAMEMKVYNPCGTIISTQTIGPFSSSTDLGTMTLNGPTIGTVNITASVKNCNFNSVTNGFVDIWMDGVYKKVILTNGNFSTVINRCTNTPAQLIMIATDLQTNQQGTPDTLNVTIGNYSAILIACGTPLQEYIHYVIDGYPDFYFVPGQDSLIAGLTNGIMTYNAWTAGPDSLNNPTRQVTGMQLTSTTGAGSYPLDSTRFTLNKRFPGNSNITQFKLTGVPVVTITEYPTNLGQYEGGTYSGSVRNTATNVVSTFTCSFRVRRDI